MSQYLSFTSLPPDEESTFVVYEKRSRRTAKAAMTIGVIVSLIFGALVVVTVFSFEKPESKMAGEDIGMLGTREDKSLQRAALHGEEAESEPGEHSQEAHGGAASDQEQAASEELEHRESDAESDHEGEAAHQEDDSLH